jgi:hypothetical protein
MNLVVNRFFYFYVHPFYPRPTHMNNGLSTLMIAISLSRQALLRAM